MFLQNSAPYLVRHKPLFLMTLRFGETVCLSNRVLFLLSL
jgi:hypothetical protein